jgi:hypothetical protein
MLDSYLYRMVATVDITQDYLISPPEKERHVRKFVIAEVNNYDFDEEEVDEDGEFRRTPRNLMPQEYQNYLRDERDLGMMTIRKTRYIFMFEKRKWKLDYHISPCVGVAILLMNVREGATERVLLPPTLEHGIQDVSDDHSYRDYVMASGQLHSEMK